MQAGAASDHRLLTRDLHPCKYLPVPVFDQPRNPNQI